MSFDVAGSVYDRFMGRYSAALAPLFADFAGVSEGQVLDVGCGPGSLTAVLVDRVGASSVTAIDPSEPFVATIRERFPEIEVHHGSAETLPLSSARYDFVLAQLVVHHMTDPVAGIREMARVTVDGGVVAACVWDHVGGKSPTGPFWTAFREFDPGSATEDSPPGTREGELVAIFESAGLSAVEGEAITFEYSHNGFDDWWAPFSNAVGPVGQTMAKLDETARNRLEALCRDVFPSDSEPLDLQVWSARALVDQVM